MSQSWKNDSEQREKFLKLALEFAMSLIISRSKMLPGSLDENINEVRNELYVELRRRLDQFDESLVNTDEDEKTRDTKVWQSKSAEDAAKTIFETYLLLELVRQIVGRLQRQQLPCGQAEMLAAIESPPTRHEAFEDEIVSLRKKSRAILTEAEHTFFDIECTRRLEDRKGGLDVAERKRWSRITKKIRGAFANPLLRIIFVAIGLSVAFSTTSAASGAESSNVGQPHQGRAIACVHQGFHQGYHQG